MNKHTAESFSIPFTHLNGTLAEMLFADAVYYLLAAKGKTNAQGHRFVETTTEELLTLTGLTRKTIRKQLDYMLQLDTPYRLIEEEGIAAHGRVLKQPLYNLTKSFQKPVSFISNFWGWALAQPLPGQDKSSRFPYAILNILLRKPNGRFTTIKELQKRTQKRDARKLPDLLHIQKAVAFLRDLNLVAEEKGGYRLLKEQFAQNGRKQYEQLISSTTTEPEKSVAWQWAVQESPQRANLALEIAALGQFNILTHGKEIFYDLTQIKPETDLAWLKYAAHRHRYRPPSPDRWKKCWQLFQNRLSRQRYGARSTKFHLKFSPQTTHSVQLTLPGHRPTELRWGKLVIWVNDYRFKATGEGRQETIFVRLQQHKTTLWERIISYEDSIVRLDLTAVLKQTSTPILLVHVSAARSINQFSIDLLLESEYITQPGNHDAN